MSKKSAKPSGIKPSNASGSKSSGATAAGGGSRREALRRQQEAEAQRARRMRMFGIAAALLALVTIAVVGGALYMNHRNKAEATTAQGTPVNANADKTGIIANPGKAKQGAPVLQVYEDYQCPACASIHRQISPLVNALAEKGEIGLEYRTMTFLDANVGNDSSMRAAVAAACSDNAGHYEAFHDTVLENQPSQEGVGYTDAQLREDFPKAAGITGQSLTDFQTCYDNEATKAFVDTVDEEAAKAGIKSTPTYRVNGKDLDLQTIGSTEQSLLDAIQKVAAS